MLGLLPVSHVLAMQSAAHMQMPSQAGSLTGTMPAGTGQDMPITCCSDMNGSYHTLCGFVVPHFAFATHSVGTDRVALSTFSAQINNRDIVTPPPKFQDKVF